MVSAPGGDIAEIASAMQAAENALQRKLSPPEVGHLFKILLKRREAPFVICNDVARLQELGRRSRVRNPLRPRDEEQLEAVLDELHNAAVNGDATIRDMLTHPNKYQVRATILVWVLRLAYRAALGGHHHPMAKVLVLKGEQNADALRGLVRVEKGFEACPDKTPIIGNVPGYAVMYCGDTLKPLRDYTARILAESLKLNPREAQRASRHALWLGAKRENRALAMFEATFHLEVVDVVLSNK